MIDTGHIVAVINMNLPNLPGGASVHPHSVHSSLGLYESAPNCIFISSSSLYNLPIATAHSSTYHIYYPMYTSF